MLKRKTALLTPERARLLDHALIDADLTFSGFVNEALDRLLTAQGTTFVPVAKNNKTTGATIPKVVKYNGPATPPAPEVLLAEVGQEPEPVTDPPAIPGVSKGIPPNFGALGPSPSGQVKAVPKPPAGPPADLSKPTVVTGREVKQEKKLVDSFDPDDTPLPRGF